MKGSERNSQAHQRHITILGVICIVCGTLAMMAPGFTGLSVAILLGILVLVAGLGRMLWSFQAGTPLRGVVAFVVGSLTLVAGIVLILKPLLAAGVLTIVLAIYFFADGALELVGAFDRYPDYGWGWLLFGGTVSLLLGGVIWVQFPLSGVWAMGILVGIKLFMIGLIMIASRPVLPSGA